MRVVVVRMMLMRVLVPVGVLSAALFTAVRVLALVPAGDSLASRSVAAALDIAVSRGRTAALARAAATAPAATASTSTPARLTVALAALALTLTTVLTLGSARRRHRRIDTIADVIRNAVLIAGRTQLG